ncbi:MAG: acyl-CoA dehydrogenase [Hyphomicrobiales bacterium]|nr:MAG: acyl-CoA dehydrogenase [Hyphomicrobiales bacterium]
MNEDFSDWIGQTQSISDVIDARHANLMAATMARPEVEGEIKPFSEGDELPLGWQWIYFLQAAPSSQLGRDGHSKTGGFLPPIPLPRRMWAGSRLEFLQPLLIGDQVEKKTEILSVTPKEGKSGPLYFVTVKHSFTKQTGLCLVEEQDLVYRSDPRPDSVAPQLSEAPAQAKFSREIVPTSTWLFRYSALTFNGHRIHYDVDYAREVEGYRNLVFHGPLSATLLLELASEIAGKQQGKQQGKQKLASFSFRAISPLFADRSFSIHANANGSEIWAANPDGKLAISAKASFVD